MEGYPRDFFIIAAFTITIETMKDSDNRRIVVLGASNKPHRASHIAVRKMLHQNINVVAVGNRQGFVMHLPILSGTPFVENVHTVSLYLRPALHDEILSYLHNLHPERVIFNPGTENPQIYAHLDEQGIEVIEACTLVLLSTGTFFS